MIKRLSEEFLEPYKKKKPKWGPLGFVTYMRTYAREVPGENRLEEWWETCRRVIEGNFSLVPDDDSSTIEEMERAYDLMFNMVWLPPGRSLWISGTDFMHRVGGALVNCWGTVIAPHAYEEGGEPKVSFPFVFLFDQLMLGGGVGYSVERKYIEQIPEVKSRIQLRVLCDPNHPDYEEVKALKPKFFAKDYLLHHPGEINTGKCTHYIVDDSREGWCEALKIVIDAHWEQEDQSYVFIDISNIRAKGEPIKGFGGVASGPAPLVEMLRFVNGLLNARKGRKITSVDAVDICNVIARCVIAGNVRRSATLALGDADDLDFIQMKDYTLPQKDSLSQEERDYIRWAQLNHRWASNNSVVIYDDTECDYDKLAELIAINGEPGIINLSAAQNYGRMIDGFQEGIDGRVKIVNPCGEISLENGEPCNLVEFFPFIADREGVDYAEALRIATRFAKRVTFAKYPWAVSAEVIKRNRRIGVSLSGLQDWILARFGGKIVEEWDEEGMPIYNPELVEALDNMYQAVREADREYSEALGCGESIKVTTVKPSGSVSLLPGVSPGMHWHYFKRGIRRIRFQEDNPLVDLLRECGYKVEPAIGSPNTVVVEFPMEAPTANLEGFRSAGDVPIEEQMAFQALLQYAWSDNMVSATISFQPHEADRIAPLLRKYIKRIKGVSMLPYVGHGYAQAPYEPVEDEEFRKMVESIKATPEEKFSQMFNIKVTNDLDSECEGGACPIR